MRESRPRAFRAAVLLFALSSANVAIALAQQTGNPPDSPKQQPTSPSVATTVASQAQSAALQPVKLFNLLEKRSIVFPDIAQSTTALTTGQKFEQFVDNSISVHIVAWSLVGSGFGQAVSSPTGFNQGWDGYAKRFGASMARQSSGQFFGTFIMASALHQDPRFFPEYKPTFKHSIKYSFQRLFVTRNDAGIDVPNISGLMGPLLGEGLANAYWPDRNRSAGDTLMRYGIDLLSRAGGNMFREYWPVIVSKMNHDQAAEGTAH